MQPANPASKVPPISSAPVIPVFPSLNGHQITPEVREQA
jgi:hypothetical protein